MIRRFFSSKTHVQCYKKPCTQMQACKNAAKCLKKPEYYSDDVDEPLALTLPTQETYRKAPNQKHDTTESHFFYPKAQNQNYNANESPFFDYEDEDDGTSDCN